MSKYVGKLLSVRVLSSYASLFVNVCVGFASMTFMIRGGGLELFGMFSILKSTVGLLSGVLSVRTGESVTRFYKLSMIESNKGAAVGILLIGIGLDCLVSILVFVVLIAIDSFVAAGMLKDEALSSVVFLFGTVSIMHVLRGVPYGFFLATERIVLLNALNMLEPIAFASLLYFIEGNLDINVVTLSFVTGALGLLVVSWVIFLCAAFGELRGASARIDGVVALDFMSYTGKLFFSSMLKAVGLNSENVVLGYLLGAQQIGLYNALKRALTIVQYISQPWGTLCYTRLIVLFEAGRRSDVKSYILKLTFKIMMAAIIVQIFVLFMLGYLLNYMKVPIEGLNVYYYALPLALAILLLISFWWARIYSNVVDPIISLKVNLANIALSLILTVAFVSQVGLIGVMLASLITNVSIGAYLYRHLFRL